jgi:hypothetical protein
MNEYTSTTRNKNVLEVSLNKQRTLTVLQLLLCGTSPFLILHPNKLALDHLNLEDGTD